MDAPQRPLSARRRQLVHTLSFQYLLVVPVLLALATAVALFRYSDVNIAMLYSQCHARSRLPGLSRLPGIGALSCTLVSFFEEALASTRSFAVMGVVLSFVAGLLTVSTIEAARICNGPNVLIAYPTGPWLVFNLLGGAFIWELVIIPAFARRCKQILAAAESDTDAAEADEVPALPATDPNAGAFMRHLAVESEVVAIPIGVALGCVLPSLLMLVYRSPMAIAIWLFFPVYVSLVRQGVRLAAVSFANSDRTLHLEAHRPSLLAVYAVPTVCSALSYGMLLWSLTQADDKKEMTKSTLRFIEVDTIFIGLTVLYWILVEAGWRVALETIGWGVIFGPGAGLCAGWIYREKHLGFVCEPIPSLEDGSRNEGDETSGEETPLLH